jgi:Sulfotransferase family
LIGATGGSGTRVVARIVRQAGMYIGSEGLNESEDPLYIADFYDRWLNAWVPQHGVANEPALLDDFRGVLARHVAGLDRPRRWGWKEPRSMYLIRLFDRYFSSFRFLHVVRDGRDMAFSSNQNQLRKHGVLAGLPQPELSPPAQSIALWAWANWEAAHFGRESLGDRYLRIRLEDLCREPATVTAQVLEFFEVDGDARALGEEIVAPASLGRWRAEDPRVIAELEGIAGPALAELGYVTDR